MGKNDWLGSKKWQVIPYLLPSTGNMLFTLLVVGLLFWVQNARSSPEKTTVGVGISTQLIPYQGRLAGNNGEPVSGDFEMAFTLYDSGSVVEWTEAYTGTNAIAVTDGLFNVMLGSQETIPDEVITGNSYLTLGIEVNGEELSPRVLLGSVPFARETFLLPDGIVTTDKIVDGAVTLEKLATGINPVGRCYDPLETNTTGITTYVDKCTVILTTNGGPVLLIAAFGHTRSGPIGAAMSARLTIDGNEVMETGALYDSAWNSGSLTWVESNLLPGMHTFKLQFSIGNAGDTAYMDNATLVAVELR